MVLFEYCKEPGDLLVERLSVCLSPVYIHRERMLVAGKHFAVPVQYLSSWRRGVYLLGAVVYSSLRPFVLLYYCQHKKPDEKQQHQDAYEYK